MKASVAALALVAGIVAFNFVDDLFSKQAETEAELATNQGDAAIQSGRDAVETVGAVNERIVERFHTTERTIQEVENAKDIDSAHAAGIDGLCVGFGVCPQDPVQ